MWFLAFSLKLRHLTHSCSSAALENSLVGILPVSSQNAGFQHLTPVLVRHITDMILLKSQNSPMRLILLFPFFQRRKQRLQKLLSNFRLTFQCLLCIRTRIPTTFAIRLPFSLYKAACPAEPIYLRLYIGSP